ncbi:hypothetical protein BC629DRAFT_1440884 [Irpex lacteus]|nr:hypothetical protein BC629DRAFT_1440884 [Irpex lacteus]
MNDYQPLHNHSSELLLYLSEEEKGTTDSEVGELRAAPHAIVRGDKPSTLLQFIFAICLILSAFLVGTNVWTSRQLSVALSDALPIPNVTHLEKADQYYGLSESSRRKLYYHGEEDSA